VPDDGYPPTIPNTLPPRHAAGSEETSVAPDERYRMLSLLGRGGMGEVWLAHDQHIDRDVAIKVLRGGRAHPPDQIARFLREARVQGRLEHPAIVPVHDIGGDNIPYFAMKRLVGTTFADVFAANAKGDAEVRARWPRRVLLTRFVDVCLAMEFAHQRGVVHRDLKPANIMLGDYGETYVLDWGLARLLGSAEVRVSDLPSSGGASRATPGAPAETLAGAMLGTPGYMSPEQMRGEAIDARTDVYALGCVLYEILTGQPAVPRDNPIEATLEGRVLRPSSVTNPMAAQASTTHPPSGSFAAEVPPELDEITLRATASEVSARTASARELGDAIQRYLDGDRDVERRRALAQELATRATVAFARGRDAARAEATRDAGRALALDPGNEAAAALLARILLEPPRDIPAPARRSIAEERMRAVQVWMRAFLWLWLLFLPLVPAAKLMGTSTWPFVLIAAEIVALAVVSFTFSRYPRALNSASFMMLMLLYVSMLITVGLVLSSLLLLPIMIIGMLPLAQQLPTVRHPIAVIVVLSLALVIPVTLEMLRIVPPTFAFSGSDLIIHSGIGGLSPLMLVLLMVLIVGGQLLTISLLVLSQRREQERAQEELHVQKWQLEQLVGGPEIGAAESPAARRSQPALT
jgi:serine/threonine-protein kinase